MVTVLFFTFNTKKLNILLVKRYYAYQNIKEEHIKKSISNEVRKKKQKQPVSIFLRGVHFVPVNIRPSTCRTLSFQMTANSYPRITVDTLTADPIAIHPLHYILLVAVL